MNFLLNILFLSNIIFTSPVNYDISLAGNFGEPRPNHFHAGIDVKTSGVEGKPIFSIGDGYISHISIGIGGFGNAVYVRHPEGYTSIYCHLKAFSPTIEKKVKRWQYEHKQYKGLMAFSPTTIPVTRGMLIAISGNSGSSHAPHLHLEIHDNYSGEMCDPLEFLGLYVEDGYAPIAHGFMAYPKAGEGVFENSSSKQSYSFSSHHLGRTFTAWGKVGFGVWANDYMETSYNRLGIRKTELFVDDTLVFKSDVGRIPSWGNMLVNSWGDYQHYRRYGVWYMHSCVEPGTYMPLFTIDKNSGYVIFNEERQYNIKYVLTDYHNNSSTYTFNVMGKKKDIAPLPEIGLMRMLTWNKGNVFQMPGVQLSTPVKAVENDVELAPTVLNESGLSDTYSFMPVSYQLFYPSELSIRLKQKVKDTSKLYIVQIGDYPIYRGGAYHDGWVTGRIKDLGAKYRIAYDDKAPVITPISLNGNLTLRFNITDQDSGLAGYEAYIDNQFVLFEAEEKSPAIMCRLSQTPIVRTGKLRQLRIVATDNRGNKQEYKTNIQY